MKKLLFICTGNTCRSPMAEGLFRKYLEDKRADCVDVSSAGLAAFAGDDAFPNAVLAACEYGADISAHKSRAVSPYELCEADLIVCMTSSHRDALLPYVDADKLMVLDIPDPYGAELEEYRKCAELIYSAFDTVFFKLKGLEIVRMEERHITYIAALEKECFSSPWSEKSLYSELEKPDARFFVAEYDGQAAGYIGANNISGEVYITNVAVGANWRRLGIGKALVERLVEESRSENAEFITLEVRQSNVAAIELYKQCGFVTNGSRKGFYDNPKEDAYIMTLFFDERGRKI